jgi:hypothetical protein
MQKSPLNGSDEGQFLSHIHCLRFLNDAFHSRTSVLMGFISDLFVHISQTVESHESLLVRKIAVESVGLLQPEQIEPVIRAALSLGSYWISETAFNACRYIAQLTLPLEARLAYFLSTFSSREFWTRYSEIRFSLELSPGMKRLHSLWRARMFDLMVYYAAIAVTTALVNFTFSVALIIFACGRTIALSRPVRLDSEGVLPVFWSLNLFRFGLLAGSLISIGFLINQTWPADEASVSFGILYLTSSELVTTAIVLIVSMLFFPWYAVPFWGPEFRKQISVAMRNAFKIFREMTFRERALLLLLIIGVGSAYAGLIWVVDAFDYTAVVNSIGYWALIFLGAALAVLLAGIAVRRWMVPGIADFWVRRNAEITEPLERCQIEETLSRLALTESRMAYLRALYERGIKPIGKWSAGHPPSFNYDESGTFLARLEARWLGVER